jgi:hypothetical protein
LLSALLCGATADNELLAEGFKGLLDPADLGIVAWVQQAPDLPSVAYQAADHLKSGHA